MGFLQGVGEFFGGKEGTDQLGLDVLLGHDAKNSVELELLIFGGRAEPKLPDLIHVVIPAEFDLQPLQCKIEMLLPLCTSLRLHLVEHLPRLTFVEKIAHQLAANVSQHVSLGVLRLFFRSAYITITLQTQKLQNTYLFFFALQRCSGTGALQPFLAHRPGPLADFIPLYAIELWFFLAGNQKSRHRRAQESPGGSSNIAAEECSPRKTPFRTLEIDVFINYSSNTALS